MVTSPSVGVARTIADVGEFGFLSRLLPRLRAERGTVVGPGQDCAVVRGGTRLLFTVDALVEDVHFHAGWMSARQLGRKSFLVNASDVAAMGGRPRFCVVSLGLPPTYPVRKLSQLQAGITSAARECGASVVGGNLSRADKLFASIALLADAPKRLITRQGARPGDRIYVTGTLGDAALGLHMLQTGHTERPARYLMRRFREPAARLRAGRLLVESGIASSMIDVSDGLLQDLGHLCRESAVGAVIRADDVPLSPAYRAVAGADPSLALHGGEDYELLCTVSERNRQRLTRASGRLGCPLACIGEITMGRTVRVVDASGARAAVGAAGYDHFRRRA